MELNIAVAWVGIALGLVSGTIQGLFFHRDDWLGGYASWQRRMLRLGHISFFGVAFVNLAYANALYLLGHPVTQVLVSPLLIAGAVFMPCVCYLAAWRKPLRHLFFLPVLSLLSGTGIFITRELLS